MYIRVQNEGAQQAAPLRPENRCGQIFLIALALLLCVEGTAQGQPLLVDGRYGRVQSGATLAPVPTILFLIGGFGQSGQFQDAVGNPDPQGWQSVDRSVEVGPAVGNFGQLWSNLANMDNCPGNSSPQWAFIDDGIVEPGTGGSACLGICYGPGGYTVNPTGGLAGPGGELWNEIWSPQMAWPGAGYGGTLAFDMYLHQELGASAAGIYAVWHVRSSDDGGTTWSEWRDHGKVFYGGPNYVRFSETITDLLLPQADMIQVAIGVHQMRALTGTSGNEATPAPYFDNVELTAYQITGPTITACESNLAQDAMPVAGFLDLANLASNRVELTRALDNQPIRVTAVANDGSPLAPGNVLLHYTIAPNPVYNAFRTVPTTGVVVGVAVANSDDIELPLATMGFAFPGDIVHYFFEAQDLTGTTTMPADPFGRGYGVFPGDPMYVSGLYPALFVFRALPSQKDDGFGSIVPKSTILFWKDSPTGVGDSEWSTAFGNLGYVEGQDYDIYTTNLPSADLDNSLADGSTASLLEGYDTIVYSSADLDYYTMDDFDALVLGSWLGGGGRYMFVTGNKLASDMTENAGGTAANFVTGKLGVTSIGPDVWPSLGGATSALVEVIDPTWTLFPVNWTISGACNAPHSGYQTFDAVHTAGSTQAAVFSLTADPALSAATRNFPAAGTEIVYLPYDLMYVLNPPIWPLKTNAPLSVRARILEGVLMEFGHLGSSVVSSVGDLPSAADLAVTTFPNPFNPRVTLAFELPRSGVVRLTIHDLRGHLVRTLVDQVLPRGQRDVVWNGVDDSGGQVASGAYFYLLEAAGKQERGKIALIK